MLAAITGLVIPEEPVYSVVTVLMGILVAVLVLPLTSRRIEEHLEPFFLVMGIIGIIAITHAGFLTNEGLREVIVKALTTPLVIHGVPIGITQVVFVAGYVFYRWHGKITSALNRALERYGLKKFIFIITVLLGLTSSVISVIVAAVILAEIMASLPLPRRKKVEVTVIASFALGMGAALTPVGEPLSTIAISKLGEHPLYLLELLGIYIITGVVVLALYASERVVRGYTMSEIGGGKDAVEAEESYIESLRSVVMRAIRVYIFVAALELLGTSFTPIAEWYFVKMPAELLYWMNTISAVVDNATLTAAEVVPGIDPVRLRFMLVALLISGGMHIPGNVPNIIAAARLRINSKEWVRIGVPLGLIILIVYFIILELTAHMLIPS
jgi:predicted cation transporter